MAETDELLFITEVGRILGVSGREVLDMIGRGELPVVLDPKDRIGKVPRSAVQRD